MSDLIKADGGKYVLSVRAARCGREHFFHLLSGNPPLPEGGDGLGVVSFGKSFT
jgi:hypothetical protein